MPVLLVISYTCELDPTTSARVRRYSFLGLVTMYFDINESAGNSRSSDKWKRPSITCFGCGKRGYYKRDCRSMKRQDRGGQGQNTATTSGTNAHASTSHGGNTPANK